MGKDKEYTRFELIEMKKEAQQEPSVCIRRVLEHRIKETQHKYNQASDDHRYTQGALHALEEFLSDITRKS